MNDSDPRPMPTAVLAAYRDPLDLRALLASSVFTNIDRFDVRDKLLDLLIAKHGNVEVEIGSGSKTLPIRKRSAQFRKNVWAGIEIILVAEEFGGADNVQLELAAVMQPYWAAWWGSMRWDDGSKPSYYFKVSSIVMGQRQMAWLAAQYARSAVDFTRRSDRQICVDAIEATEAWSLVPSESNRKRVEVAVAVAVANTAADANAADANASAFEAAFAAIDAAGSVSSAAAVGERVHVAAANAAYAAANAAAYSADAAYASAYAGRKRLCELTKQLITPTLVTSPSR